MARKALPTAVLRVELLDIEPLIWRRVRVAGSVTFKQLHETLQVVMGWHNSHLHEFRAGELILGMKDVEELGERENLQG